MARRPALSPWLIILAIYVLAAPVIVLGGLSSMRLLPGLPVSALMFLSFALVAILAAYRSDGWKGVGTLLRRIGDWRRAQPRSWLALSLLLMPFVLVVEYFVMRGLGLPLPAPDIAWWQAPVLFLLFFVAAACEELAWSATLLEPLQRVYGALVAALVIGVFWALLHVVPLIQAGRDVSWIFGQCVFTVAIRVVLAWLYNVSGRSLFAAIVCHAAYNTAWQLFPNQGSGYNPWITAALTAVVAVFAIAAFGAATLSGRHVGPPRVTPPA